MKKEKLLLISLIAMILVFSVFSTVGFGYNIQHGNEETIYNDDYYTAFPGCTNSSNGTWVVAFGYGSLHSDPNMVLKGMVSHDFGETWSSPFLIRDGPGKTADAELITAPNGNIICTFRQSDSDNGGWSISTDNGTTWTYKGVIDGGTSKVFAVTGLHNVSNIIYAAAYQHDSGQNCSVWKSTDNGSSWQFHSWVDSNLGNDEWDFFPLNETHWIAFFREYPDTAGRAWWAESFDGGLTWENWTDRTELIGGEIHAPQFNWLNEEQHIILLTGRIYNKSTSYLAHAYWISDDNGTTWQNETIISDGVPGTDDMGYTGVIEEYRRAYMVYYRGKKVTAPSGNCPNIYGMWIYDNTTYAGEEGTSVSFIDICGKANNSYIPTTSRWGNITRVTSENYTGSGTFLSIADYNVQIANDSAFTDIFANVTNLPDQDPTSQYWYFKLDKTIEEYGGSSGTHYYRTRAKVWVRTT